MNDNMVQAACSSEIHPIDLRKDILFSMKITWWPIGVNFAWIKGENFQYANVKLLSKP